MTTPKSGKSQGPSIDKNISIPLSEVEVTVWWQDNGTRNFDELLEVEAVENLMFLGPTAIKGLCSSFAILYLEDSPLVFSLSLFSSRRLGS